MQIHAARYAAPILLRKRKFIFGITIGCRFRSRQGGRDPTLRKKQMYISLHRTNKKNTKLEIVRETVKERSRKSWILKGKKLPTRQVPNTKIVCHPFPPQQPNRFDFVIVVFVTNAMLSDSALFVHLVSENNKVTLSSHPQTPLMHPTA